MYRLCNMDIDVYIACYVKIIHFSCQTLLHCCMLKGRGAIRATNLHDIVMIYLKRFKTRCVTLKQITGPMLILSTPSDSLKHSTFNGLFYMSNKKQRRHFSQYFFTKFENSMCHLFFIRAPTLILKTPLDLLGLSTYISYKEH